MDPQLKILVIFQLVMLVLLGVYIFGSKGFCCQEFIFAIGA